MRIALIRDGRVVNVVEAGRDFVPEAGTRALPAGKAAPGWIHDGGALRPPPDAPRVPDSVSMFQAREALRQTRAATGGTLLDLVNAHVEARRLQQPTLALAWEYATKVERRSDFVAALAATLGLDEAAIDRLFRLAATIRA